MFKKKKNYATNIYHISLVEINFNQDELKKIIQLPFSYINFRYRWTDYEKRIPWGKKLSKQQIL